MDTRKALPVLLLFAFMLGMISFPAYAHANEDTAKQIVREMSQYVGSQKTIALSFESSIEIITPQLEKIQFTNSGDALLQRPNKLRAHRWGGYADVYMYFDGITVSVYGEHINKYARFDAPGSVDDLIHLLREGHGISLPGSDLLLGDSFPLLMADVIEAKYIGRGVINGVECEHLAFRNFETDWQLWVEAGEKPIPRKMVVTSKTMNSAPQYSITIKDWKTNVDPTTEDFVFIPPIDAKKIKETELIEFDELPPEVQGDENQ
ncbi:DUF2092 domain-containing protein [Desulfogranum marinum]|uniref:DUF2092 domain-containing protein n=1 Tax=Desulfogranum marinum TaxID=453220 RepID=UPI0029C740F0|nr:DUF2092 domain-containing protein [Desulfogranum marinum]